MTAGRKKKVIIGILVALCMTVTGCAGSVKKGTKYLEEKDYKNAEVEFQDAVDKKKNLGEAAIWNWINRKRQCIILTMGRSFQAQEKSC